MKNYKAMMKKHQIKWRKNYLPEINKKGKFRKIEYEHILPWEKREFNFYPPIRRDLFSFIDVKGIQPHASIHNLLSSWVLCSNMYWPFNNKEGSESLCKYLSKEANISIDKIEEMDLEYECENDSLKPAVLLGETRGKRGSGQTSPDLAIKFKTKDNKKGIFLIESKFTEDNFEPCSGYVTKPGREANPDKSRCERPKDIIKSNFSDCYLLTLGRYYWDLLGKSLDRGKYISFTQCPISNCCYQIFRQQALAKGLEKIYDISISCVAIDSRNEKIINSSCKGELKPLPEGWKDLFPESNFIWLTHNNWFEFVKENNSGGKWDNWIDYIENRYFKI